jgi:hypothetical protein
MSKWLPGSEYAKLTVRSHDGDLVDRVLAADGIGVDHWRPLLHSRPPSDESLDHYLFCCWERPSRPIGTPSIEDVALRALRAADLQAMVGSAHT